MLTKSDLAAIKSIIEESNGSLRKEMNERFDGVRKEMNERFDGVRKEMNERFDGVFDLLQQVLGDAGEISDRNTNKLRNDLEPRIEKLENIHPQSQHSSL